MSCMKCGEEHSTMAHDDQDDAPVSRTRTFSRPAAPQLDSVTSALNDERAARRELEAKLTEARRQRDDQRELHASACATITLMQERLTKLTGNITKLTGNIIEAQAEIERLRARLESVRLRAGYIQHNCKNMTEARMEAAAIESRICSPDAASEKTT